VQSSSQARRGVRLPGIAASEVVVYVPHHFAADDDDVRSLLENHGAADLVTATAHGLLATFLPFVFDPTVGEQGALLGHVARPNDQWRQTPIGPPEATAMVIVRGPDAYVSPSWYAAKAEHGGRTDLELRHRTRLRIAGHP
jgi:transcriptional regulator